MIKPEIKITKNKKIHPEDPIEHCECLEKLRDSMSMKCRRFISHNLFLSEVLHFWHKEGFKCYFSTGRFFYLISRSASYYKKGKATKNITQALVVQQAEARTKTPLRKVKDISITDTKQKE